MRPGIVVLSLPDGSVSDLVAHEIVDATDRRTTHVVDTSTIGVPTARSIDVLLAGAGLSYVDAPVSGGVAGAQGPDTDRHVRRFGGGL